MKLKQRLTALLILCILALPLGTYADDTTDIFSNLVAVEDPRVAAAFIDPEADFSVFRRAMILDTYVAFRSGWQRDQRRGTRRINVTTADMERIKEDVANLFHDVFVETLSQDDGFDIVDYADEDVILIRPAIIDLDITAPDTQSAGRSRSYTAETGSATLYIELYDSVSGQIIGRALDRQTARNAGGQIRWTNRVTNSADARRMFGRWAQHLRDFLDDHYLGNKGE